MGTAQDLMLHGSEPLVRGFADDWLHDVSRYRALIVPLACKSYGGESGSFLSSLSLIRAFFKAIANS
jgi:hypothetical protein